jgi:hypothetical protein
MARDYSLFGEVLSKIKDGITFTFTASNIAEWDDFLIFNDNKEKTIITIHTKSVPYWVEFSNDEPILLEDCPDSFLRSILKNI